ncbi:MAG: flagellar biosynthetic protein FliO [FCB group bacterium]|nr:flagellar biosynthetic protein FliO [FCB group bacterium]
MFGHRIVIFCLLICLIPFAAIPVRADSTDQVIAGETDPAVTGEDQNLTSVATTEETAEVPTVSDMLLPSLTRIALSLMVIIVVIYGVVYLLRKLSGNRLGGGRKNKTIQMVEQTYLAPKKSVCLIKMADRAVLVGVTDTHISMLTEMEWDTLPQDSQPCTEEKQTGFQGVLNDAVGKLFGTSKNKGASGEQIA